MSTKIYSSSVAGGKFGISEQGESIQYETQKDKSGLVLFFGLIPAFAIVIFIITHI